MSRKAGQLLWHRMRITVTPGNTDFDTGLTQLNKSFESESINEPSYTQRIQVLPMAPLTAWAAITHTEPFLSGGTIHIIFRNLTELDHEINFLVIDPHSVLGPGAAVPYGMI